MRFRIDTEKFKKAIEITSHATTSSNLTPILENILIDAQYKRLVLTGNNLDMAIEYVIEEGATIEVEGKFTISSKFLSSYVSLVQEDEIEIELEKNGSLLFTTKSSETKFKGTSAEKFPIIPVINSNTPLVLGAKDMKAAIEKTIFSTAEGNIRPMLAGIYLRTLGESIIIASTDSFRLSEFRVKLSEPQAVTSSIIIPERTAQEIARLITEDSTTIALYIQENQLLVTSGNTRLSSRLLSGRFPDYETFFPTEYNTKTVVLRSEFVTSLKQANLVSRENNYNTRIESTLEGRILISTGDTEVGASSINISGNVEGKSEIIGLNSQYLLEALSVIREDYVSFEFKSPLSPIVIKGVPAENGAHSYRHLIMPLKI